MPSFTRPESINARRSPASGLRALVAAVALPLLVASGIVFGGVPTAVAGAPSGSVVDQSNDSDSGVGFWEIPGNVVEFGQTFTAGKSGLLTAVDVNLLFALTGETDGVTNVQIMGTTTSGAPDGTVLATGSVAAGFVGVATVTLSAPVPVVSGDQYTIVLSSDNYIEPATYQPANYAAGDFFQLFAGAWKRTTESTSLYFATYVDQSANAAPTLSGAPASTITSGLPYSYSYTAAGSPAPDMTVSGGSLPPGMALSKAGVLSGTPTTAGDYPFTVQAGNGVGTAATVDSAITVQGLPGAPTNVVATANDGQAVVTFVAPANNGGSTILSYTAVASPGGLTGTSTRSPIIVNGLANGTSYTFTVRATNSVGLGPASVASTSVTPKTAPDVPTGLTATPQSHAVQLSWTAPNDGGSEITDYVIQKSTDNRTWEQADTPTGTSDTITGLTNGTTYYFRVAAQNVAGESSSSASVFATPFTTPDAPAAPDVDPGDGTVALSWSAPASTGGSDVTGYDIRYGTDGSTWTDAPTPSGTAATITGLTNGTGYSFEVRAENAAGPGAWSALATATPCTVAGAPTGLTATGSDGAVALAWAAPASDGGAAITAYDIQYRETGATTWLDADPSTDVSATITGLTNEAGYDFRVAAVNAAGAGDWSDPVTTVPFTFAVAFDNGDGHGIAGSTLSAGDRVSISGSDLPPGATVTVELHSAPIELGTATVGPDGDFGLEVTIPAGTTGSHRLVATITGAGVTAASASVAFSVASAATSPLDVASLAFTGESVPWLSIGSALVILLGVGVLLVLMMRRRRIE